MVDIHRYMVGTSSTGSTISPSGSSEPSRVCTTAGVAETGVRSSAVDKTLRLIFDLDCFLSNRLIVSACNAYAHDGSCSFDRHAHLFVFELLFRQVFALASGFFASECNLRFSELFLFARGFCCEMDVSVWLGDSIRGGIDRGRRGMNRPR